MRGTKFRYSGRTEREILTENLNALRQQHLANNTSPSKRKANSVPATPSSPQGDLAEIREFCLFVSGLLHFRGESQRFNESFYLYVVGYSSLPRSTMSEPLGCSGQITSGYCPDNMPLLMENVSEEARRANGTSTKHDYRLNLHFYQIYLDLRKWHPFRLLLPRLVRTFVHGKWLRRRVTPSSSSSASSASSSFATPSTAAATTPFAPSTLQRFRLYASGRRS